MSTIDDILNIQRMACFWDRWKCVRNLSLDLLHRMSLHHTSCNITKLWYWMLLALCTLCNLTGISAAMPNTRVIWELCTNISCLQEISSSLTTISLAFPVFRISWTKSFHVWNARDTLCELYVFRNIPVSHKKIIVATTLVSNSKVPFDCPLACFLGTEHSRLCHQHT